MNEHHLVTGKLTVDQPPASLNATATPLLAGRSESCPTDRSRTSRYVLREPNRGEIVAHHVRVDRQEGKRIWWELPDGSIGLGGLRTADLPLYGAARARAWDCERPVIVVEGEKAAAALYRAGYQVAGTVTGAAGCPNREPLVIFAGHEVILWPDADEVGRRHMQAVAAMLGEPGEIVGHPLRWIEWGSNGADAADALEAEADVDALVAVAEPVPPAVRAEVVPFRRPEVSPASIREVGDRAIQRSCAGVRGAAARVRYRGPSRARAALPVSRGPASEPVNPCR